MRVEGQGMAADISLRKEANIVRGLENKPAVEKQSPVTQNQTKKSQPNTQEIIIATEMVNEAFKIAQYHLQFKIHEKSGRISVKMIDSVSEEVIREIPPEKMLEFAAHIKEILSNAAGVLVDELV